jgi:NADPH-dependent glutamate synthase beta subunit-like oxidoreductase
LVYGIPEFRLPKSIVKAEVDYIEKLGVKLTPDALIGRLFTIEELSKKASAQSSSAQVQAYQIHGHSRREP